MSNLNSKIDMVDELNSNQVQVSILDYIENYLYIKYKDGRVGLFKLNKPQRKLYNLIKKMKQEELLKKQLQQRLLLKNLKT
jgi:hypothetical protein